MVEFNNEGGKRSEGTRLGSHKKTRNQLDQIIQWRTTARVKCLITSRDGTVQKTFVFPYSDIVSI